MELPCKYVPFSSHDSSCIEIHPELSKAWYETYLLKPHARPLLPLIRLAAKAPSVHYELKVNPTSYIQFRLRIQNLRARMYFMFLLRGGSLWYVTMCPTTMRKGPDKRSASAAATFVLTHRVHVAIWYTLGP